MRCRRRSIGLVGVSVLAVFALGSMPQEETLPLERFGECPLRNLPVPGKDAGPPVGIDILPDPPVETGTAYTYGGVAIDDPALFDQDSVFIERGDTDTAAVDPEDPVPGAVFACLVRGNNDCGTGSWGTDSTGAERPVTPPAF